AERRSRLRGVLVVAEVALALVLLTGAGLLLQSFSRLTATARGFATRNPLTFQLSLPAASYRAPARAAAFFAQLEERLAAFPGVLVGVAAAPLPRSGGSQSPSYRYESLPVQAGGAGPQGCPRVITPGYLRA